MRSSITLVACLLIFYSCSKKTSLPLVDENIVSKDEEDYNRLLEEKSYIVINYALNKKGIIDTFQYNIDDFLNDTMYFPEYDAMAIIKRSTMMNVEFDDKKVLIDLPLELQITKSTFFGDVKADGGLSLSLISEMLIDPYWQFSTKTKVVDHTWTRKPKLRIGISLPVEYISNKILERLKPEIEYNIDENMRAGFDLKTRIQQTANLTLIPYKINEVYGGWMTTQVDTAYISGAMNKEYETKGKIMMTAKTFISTDKPDVPPVAKTPVFAWRDQMQDSSKLRFQLDLSYDFLQNIANESVRGRVFSDGDKKITVHDIVISSEGEKLVMKARVYGSFNGTILIKGRPYYNRENQVLMTSDIDIDINTGNILHSAASWLMKGRIKTELSRLLEFPLKDKLSEAQIQVDDLISNYGKQYDMDIQAAIGSVDIAKISVEKTRIRSIIEVNFYFYTYLKNLRFFRD